MPEPRAIADIMAERMKPNPRSVNEVLIDTFGGDRLRYAVETEGAEGLVGRSIRFCARPTDELGELPDLTNLPYSHNGFS